MSNEIIVKDKRGQMPAVDQTDNSTAVMKIIERAATNPQVDIDKMERLMAMQERIFERDARMAYNVDMANMQSAMPVIAENGAIVVGKDVRSRYAKFEDIIKAIQPLLQEHGFSVSFKSNFVDNMLEVTGIISHRGGHSEQTTMKLPFDSSGSKNNVQAIGSSVSYGKRYCICMLLNIATGGEDNEDNDGNDVPQTPVFVTDKDIKALKKAAKAVGKDEKYICEKANIKTIDMLLMSRYAPCMNHLQSLMENKQ